MNEQLKSMSEVELKAAVYDRIAVLERAQLEIKALNEELSSRFKQAQEAAPEVAVEQK